MPAIITGIVVLLMGLALAIGGVWLISLGGSWYYLIGGLGLLVSGGLLMARRAAGLWTYGLVVLGTLGWAIWEVGFDWWALAPRGDVLVLVGIWMLTPWVTRSIRHRFPDRPPAAWRGAGIPLSLAILLSAGVAAYAMVTPSHVIEGRLPMDRTAASDGSDGVPPGEWHRYGRTHLGTRYSPLAQITPENVEQLEVAWHYHTGDIRGPGDPLETTYQVTPLKIGDWIYLCTPHQYVIALDPETGEERWRFDPVVEGDLALQHLTCRGVSYHTAAAPGPGPCQQRLFLPTADARLIALDALTGEKCTNFGGGDGQINLWEGMPNIEGGFYYSTSPPVVTDRLIIIGGAVNDNVSVTEPSGVIRAYDVNSGDLVWAFDPGNPDLQLPLEPGQTYTPNSPNSWTIMSYDPALGLVYVPFGNQPPDQWGGNRSPAVERYSSAVVALDANTGEERWVYQTVHHDLWDYDVPSQPSLLDLDIDGRTIPALVQPTKQGEIYVLDRRTGQPILPVEERPVPQGAAEGDYTAPTQPVSALSFGPPPLSGRDMWGATLFDQLLCRVQFHQYRYEGRYTPPSTQGSLIHPGNFGVFNWGSIAVDPVRDVAFTTPSYLAFVSKLIPRENPTETYVTEGERPALNENFGAPFAVELKPFTSPLGLPCQAPPWGYVAGADLRTGEIAWMHRNGTIRDRAPIPLPFKMGVPDLGGPVITGSGLAFMSGTLDYFVRAYQMETGEQLWESRLPAGGQATPMTYEGEDGRQYLLVVAGGHGSLGTKAGDSIIAYALPPS